MAMMVTANSAGAKPPMTISDFSLAAKPDDAEDDDDLIGFLKKALPPKKENQGESEEASPQDAEG